jgi:hypothetical protein
MCPSRHSRDWSSVHAGHTTTDDADNTNDDCQDHNHNDQSNDANDNDDDDNNSNNDDALANACTDTKVARSSTKICRFPFNVSLLRSVQRQYRRRRCHRQRRPHRLQRRVRRSLFAINAFPARYTWDVRVTIARQRAPVSKVLQLLVFRQSSNLALAQRQRRRRHRRRQHPVRSHS